MGSYVTREAAEVGLNPLLSEAGFFFWRPSCDGHVAPAGLNPLLSEAGFFLSAHPPPPDTAAGVLILF